MDNLPVNAFVTRINVFLANDRPSLEFYLTWVDHEPDERV